MKGKDEAREGKERRMKAGTQVFEKDTMPVVSVGISGKKCILNDERHGWRNATHEQHYWKKKETQTHTHTN